MSDVLSAHFGVSSKHTVSSLCFDLHNVGKMEVGADSFPTLGDSHSCKDWDAVDSINVWGWEHNSLKKDQLLEGEGEESVSWVDRCWDLASDVRDDTNFNWVCEDQRTHYQK